jgi:hypothetical protein
MLLYMDNTNTQVPKTPLVPVRPSLNAFDVDADTELRNKRLEEIIYSYFEPDDFVKVINVLEYTFYWQTFDPKDEVITPIYHYNVQMKSAARKDPKIEEIGPKEIRILRGWNAVRMIADMVKFIKVQRSQAQKATMPGVKTISASWANNTENKKIIETIFLGVATPTFNEADLLTPSKVAQDVTAEAIVKQIESEQLKDLPKFDNFQSVDNLAKELGIDLDASQES